jgi:hypothetical protein
MITISESNRELAELGGMDPSIKRHLDLQIQTLRNAFRDADR